PQGQVEAGRDLGDGEDVAAQGGDGPLLDGQLGRPLPQRGGRDQRLDLQLGVGRPGAAPRHGGGADPSAAGGWLVFGSGHARPLYLAPRGWLMTGGRLGARPGGWGGGGRGPGPTH